MLRVAKVAIRTAGQFALPMAGARAAVPKLMQAQASFAARSCSTFTSRTQANLPRLLVLPEDSHFATSSPDGTSMSSEKYVDCFFPVPWTSTGACFSLKVASEHGVWVEFVRAQEGRSLTLIRPTLVRPRPLPSVYVLSVYITPDKRMFVDVDGERYKDGTYDLPDLPTHAAVCVRGKVSLMSVGEVSVKQGSACKSQNVSGTQNTKEQNKEQSPTKVTADAMKDSAVKTAGTVERPATGGGKPATTGAPSPLHAALLRKAESVNREGEVRRLSEYITLELPKQVQYPVSNKLTLQLPSSPLAARKEIQESLEGGVLSGLKTKWREQNGSVLLEVTVDGLSEAM